jgi:hypothetical protein
MGATWWDGFSERLGSGSASSPPRVGHLETLRAGLGARAQPPKRYRLRPRRLGLRPGIDLDRALQLAAAMEDEATARKLELRK